MRYNILIGIGLSAQGMSWCICQDKNNQLKLADQHSEFTVLDFQEKPVNISGLLDVIDPYRRESSVAISSPEAGLKKLIKEKGYIKFLDNFDESTSFVGALIASCVNEGNLVLDTRFRPLLTRVLQQDFLMKDVIETPAALALKCGLGRIIHMAHTETIGISQQVGGKIHHLTAFDAANHSNNAYAGQDWGRRR